MLPPILSCKPQHPLTERSASIFFTQVIDVYEPPEHLVLHHDHVTEGLTGALVGVITLKDPQLSHLSIQLLYDPDSAFEVKNDDQMYHYESAEPF